MFWLWWLWMALTAGVMITSYITMARGDKWPSRALLEAIVANLIFGALLVLRSLQIPITRRPRGTAVLKKHHPLMLSAQTERGCCHLASAAHSQVGTAQRATVKLTGVTRCTLPHVQSLRLSRLPMRPFAPRNYWQSRFWV